MKYVRNLPEITSQEHKLTAQILFEIAENGVVFEKMREGRRVRDVVGGDDVDLAITQSRTKNIPPDAAEPVDAYLDCHSIVLLDFENCRVCVRSATPIGETRGE